MSLRGCDISNWQGAPDFDAVKASGMEFVAVKASEGTSFYDPQFARNWAELRRVGLPRIGYHFAQPDRSSPEAQAAWFLACIQRGGGLTEGDGLCLDMETGTGNLRDWTVRFLQTIEAAAGFKPWLYSGEWFMAAHGLDGDETLATYGLWLAAYQSTQPATPAPWPVLACWQYSSTSSVPGIVGPVDVDVFFGDAAALAKYGKPATARTAFDDLARWQTVKYLAGGSGIADLTAWLAQHEDQAG